mgnify:CR=1 FL=1
MTGDTFGSVTRILFTSQKLPATQTLIRGKMCIMSDVMSQVARRADAFFMGTSPIHDAMHRLANTFREMKIPFAIAGAMAANAHGHRRTTADVDILIRADDLQRFKDAWIGHGWVDKFEGSKNFRDAVHDVNIDALIVGQYPGDGLPKPVAFPQPEAVIQLSEEGLPYLLLPTLIELKLASGMTATHRLQDMADVIQLIKVNRLTLEYSTNLNAYVREKFAELWQAAQTPDDY